MKFLIINTEAFSPKGAGKKDNLTFYDLPWAIQKFLSAFPNPFIVLDESSKIKQSVAMFEKEKSTRSRLIRLLNQFGHRCIMSGTLMSKSPTNLYDQFDFLEKGYFPETMWEFAEKYCILMTLHTARGRRVLIDRDTYDKIRSYLVKIYSSFGEGPAMTSARSYIERRYGVRKIMLDHIIEHKEYSPFVDIPELMKRIAGETIFVKRKDIFDIKYDRFIKEPIMHAVEVSASAKKIGNELVKLGFTDRFTLPKPAALQLQIRLQDICNGFEPVEDKNGQVNFVAFKENSKLEALMELLEEIDVEKNQVVVWSSRKLLLRACADAFRDAGISYVVYDGDAKDSEKEEAEEKFKNREAQVFLANQASGAYGLNCLADCDYVIHICVDGSVERYYQAMSRSLRGQLTAPKFAYAIYVKGSVEERTWEKLRIGQELIGAESTREIFEFT